MKPTIKDVVDLIRDRYGLSMSEALELLRTPIHPRELRDEFAMRALTGIVSNPESGCNSTSDLAHYAYQCADSMLKERIKNENQI